MRDKLRYASRSEILLDLALLVCLIVNICLWTYASLVMALIVLFFLAFVVSIQVKSWEIQQQVDRITRMRGLDGAS